MSTSNTQQRIIRRKRIRAKVKGTAERPRLAVFRSNRLVTAQLIDDEKGVTIVSAHAHDMSKGKKTASLMEQAKTVGERIAKAAKEKGITAAVFDRGGFTYMGRIKALAEAARNGGLQF